ETSLGYNRISCKAGRGDAKKAEAGSLRPRLVSRGSGAKGAVEAAMLARVLEPEALEAAHADPLGPGEQALEEGEQALLVHPGGGDTLDLLEGLLADDRVLLRPVLGEGIVEQEIGAEAKAGA